MELWKTSYIVIHRTGASVEFASEIVVGYVSLDASSRAVTFFLLVLGMPHRFVLVFGG